ncbi:MAG: hypothetical protein H6559_34715 [Lewinellaceae bacterium]|nr:hypothetical protein [Lewinellaceae bacterium]
MAIIALYTGVVRTSFIIVDTVILGVVNIALDYGLIFYHWGLPPWALPGRGW